MIDRYEADFTTLYLSPVGRVVLYADYAQQHKAERLLIQELYEAAHDYKLDRNAWASPRLWSRLDSALAAIEEAGLAVPNPKTDPEAIL